MFITFDHLHGAPGLGVRPGLCHKGTRQFFARYNLDWNATIAAGGIDEEALIATGDAFALRVVAYAHKLADEGGNGQ